MEISSFSFPPQQDFTSPPPPHLRPCPCPCPRLSDDNDGSMSQKRKFEDFDASDYPVQKILNNFVRLNNETNSEVVLANLLMEEQVLPPVSKRAREKNVAADDDAEEAISKSSDQEIPVQEILNNFLRPDNETNSYTDFDHTNLYDFTNREVVGDMVMNKEQVLLPVSTSTLKRAREKNVVENDNAEQQQPLQQQRRLWVKNRSNAWWEQCNRPDFPELEFKKAFRMGKTTFDFICTELESVVTKKDTMLRLAIPVRQRVAVCIWRLATGAPLREVSKRFGLGISTCHKLVLEVCTAIRGVLMAKFVQWPDDTKMEEIKSRFEVLSGIQNVGGSMYTTHIPTIAPKESVATYFNKRHTERNQKPSYSVTIQGVVDCNGIFTDVCIGWPGSMTDDEILEKSALYERANRGNLNGIYVVGSSGFPLTDWILVPFTHKNLTWTQHAFNEKVNDVQKVAKEAFMRLKARWSSLQKRTEVKLQDLPVVLGACCVLHNVCEMRGEELSQELRFDLFDDEVVPGNVVRSMNAMQARDQIAHKLLHHNHSSTNFL